MDHLAIIPARSGSKGLKDKNIKCLQGKPLLAYSISAAIESGVFSEVMVSTDSTVYAKVAEEYGARVPFLRSEATSGDMAGSWDAVKEVLQEYLIRGKRFDTVCLLQPTSPLRNAQDILNGYNELYERDADAITAVCEVEHSPLWSMTLEEDHSLINFRKCMLSVPRQKLTTYYRLNGALYIRRIAYRTNEIALLDRKEYAYIMDRQRSIDIDSIEDFAYASFMMTYLQRK